MGVILELKGIEKSFHTNRVLKSVSIALYSGEVHAIVGENGAGKSTLMKIIGGVYKMDSGAMTLDNEEIYIDSPVAAIRRGISLVHQELSLADNRSVGQNIYCHREPVNSLGFIHWKQLTEDTRGLFRDMGVDIDPNARAGSLNVARQQLVEIAKALSMKARIIIMDEPTSSLSEMEVEHLYKIVEKLRDRGVAVVFISHKLNEVFRMANRISVLRDGELVSTVRNEETTPDEVIRLMVGRHLGDLYPPKSEYPGEVIAKVENLGNQNQFRNISFEVRAGEILGLAGLVGAQRSESMLALFGAAPKTSGKISILGEEVEISSPRAAIAAGLCYLSEDRRSLGLFQTMSTAWNIVVSTLNRVTDRFGFYRNGSIREVSQGVIDLLDVNPKNQDLWVQNLSGGNQQKVLLGKWLMAKPRVLIVDEPTRGVDVGAKSQIHRKLRELSNAGIGVVVISSEQPEIVGLCDRVLVYREGQIVAELISNQVTQEEIVRYATL